MIKLEKVSKIYNTAGNLAIGIKNINLEFKNNEFVAIIGESGSGKSTLVKVLSGMTTYEEGKLFYLGEDTSYFTVGEIEEYRRKNVSFITQEYSLIDSYTVYQNVEVPLLLEDISKNERHEKIMNILKLVGLENRAKNRGTKLSGGEKQRVAIARALASDKRIIVCDEPTGNLDSKTGAEIVELIKTISKDRLVLFVTHNFEQIKHIASRKIRMHDGQIIEDQILTNNTPGEIIELKNEKDHKKILFKLALKNIFSTPKRTLFLLIIFLSTIFFIISDSGDSRNNDYYIIDRYYGRFDSLQSNLDRVMLKKYDNSLITSAEINELRNHKNVESIIYNDYLIDSSINLKFQTDDVKGYYDNYMFYSIDYYKNSYKLLHGVDPKEDEVAVSEGYYVQYNSFNMTNFTKEDFINNITIGIEGKDYKISGIVDRHGSYNARVYFNQMIFKDLKFINQQEIYNVVAVDKINNYSNISFLNSVLNQANDDVTKINIYAKDISKINIEDYTIKYSLNNFKDFELEVELNSSNTNLVQSDSVVEHTVFAYVPNDMLTTKYYEKYNGEFQLSLILKDENDLSILEELSPKYDMLHGSHFEASNETNIILTPIEYIFDQLFKIIKFLIIYFVLSIILTMIFKTKKEDFNVFRTIGYSKKSLYFISIIENLIMIISSFTLFLIFGYIYYLTFKSYTVSVYDLRWIISSMFEFIIVFFEDKISIINILYYYFIITTLVLFVSFRVNKKIFNVTLSESIKD